LDRRALTWWFVRPELDRTRRPRILLDAPHSHFREAEGLQRGRKLQTLTFRDKRTPRQECIEVCHETSNEHGKPE